jgi:tetratricopeptide (TPR) repeat protein
LNRRRRYNARQRPKEPGVKPRTLLFGTVLLATHVSAATPSSKLPLDELLTGAALFGAPLSQQAMPREEVFAIDDEMRAFVDEEVFAGRTASKLRLLVAAMRERGLFSLEYTANDTRAVRDTFHQRQGNCLSFTMLFVALAREADLRATYQMVETQPVWSSDGNYIILSSHINVLIKDESESDHVVDFNIEEVVGNEKARTVSDRYVLALFYNNFGAEALIRQDIATSFTYFAAAINATPKIAAPWINLGVLYSQRGLLEHAESAYLHALDADPRNQSVLTNLANVYERMGNTAAAEEYRVRARHHRERNPYYHYSLAHAAYRDGRLDDTLELLRRAIRLKRDEHKFYSLQGQVQLELGQRSAAASSFTRARDSAMRPDLQERYSAEIAALADNGEPRRARNARQP